MHPAPKWLRDLCNNLRHMRERRAPRKLRGGLIGWMHAMHRRRIETPHFKLLLEDRPGYLYAHVSGPRRSFVALRGYWLAIIEECRRLQTRRLMVANELQGQPVLHELVEVIETILNPALRDVRMAFVHLAPSDRALIEFAEVLLRRRGIAAHTFLCEESAEVWLVGSARKAQTRSAA